MVRRVIAIFFFATALVVRVSCSDERVCNIFFWLALALSVFLIGPQSSITSWGIALLVFCVFAVAIIWANLMGSGTAAMFFFLYLLLNIIGRRIAPQR